MQLFHFGNALFSTSGDFVSHRCSVPVRLAFNVIWSCRPKAGPCLWPCRWFSTLWGRKREFEPFKFNRSIYLFILLKSDYLPLSRSKVPDLELDLGRGRGRSLRTRRYSQALAASPRGRQWVPAGQGALLSSTSFAEEGGQRGAGADDLVQARRGWVSPARGEEWGGWWLVLMQF